MKKLLFVLMCAVMLFGTTTTVNAEHGDRRGDGRDWRGDRGEWRGGIRSRIHDAKERIDRGIEHGSLTRHEARRLNRELDHILNKIDRMKSDGYLSERERERINRDLDRLDRDIRREKHDDERRGDWRDRRP